jgi:hypothetical protein
VFFEGWERGSYIHLLFFSQKVAHAEGPSLCWKEPKNWYLGKGQRIRKNNVKEKKYYLVSRIFR